MDKLKMHSINGVDENVKKIAGLFPNCVTERKNEKGEVELAVDFDMLRQELSSVVVEGNEERYQFTWPDKKKSILLANAPIAKTLRPCREESVNFDTTENLYIEGDNLEVLKLLQETYLGKIKMIYIDPPYNTGNDFVYEDDFAQSADEYLANSGQFDEEGNRLFANTESNGRFHTDWLNMIYPRLKLAKDLLADDGVIFISIDDGEADNLRKACNDVFGESNFVADLTVVNNLKGRNDKKYIARANERLLMFVKSADFSEHGLELDDSVVKAYNEKDNLGRYRLLELRKRGGPDTKKDRPNMYYPFYVNTMTGEVSLEESERFSQIALPVKSNGDDGRWRWGKDTARKNISFLYGKKVGNKYNIYEKDYLESNDGARRVRPKSVLSGASYSTDVATKEYRSIMGKVDFNNPKPVALLTDLIVYATHPNEDAIILDFFSGSSTTAHAVMKANAEDGGHRKFIMVQLPEETDEKSEAYKAGYKNICEIGKERIRRAGAKIKEDNPMTTQELDVGFRVLKCDTTNMKDVYYNPTEYQQSMFGSLADNIKEDRTPEDLLFQVMLDLGVLLSGKIEETTIAGKKVFNVEGNYLIACFDENVTDEVITAIAKQKPYYFVMRDSSMASDSVASNFEQIFETYSPTTERRVL
jgi:adenine-specific DNA-methyltransferase